MSGRLCLPGRDAPWHDSHVNLSPRRHGDPVPDSDLVKKGFTVTAEQAGRLRDESYRRHVTESSIVRAALDQFFQLPGRILDQILTQGSQP